MADGMLTAVMAAVAVLVSGDARISSPKTATANLDVPAHCVISCVAGLRLFRYHAGFAQRAGGIHGWLAHALAIGTSQIIGI